MADFNPFRSGAGHKPAVEAPMTRIPAGGPPNMEGGPPGPGFRSGAVNSPVAQGHLMAAETAGKGLGEATSFAGGAGAPAAVPITRGMTTTFVIPPKTPPGGAGFVAQPGTGQEFESPMRAGQAFNQPISADLGARGLTSPKAGTFRPEGMTLEEEKNRGAKEAAAAYTKRPDLEAQALFTKKLLADKEASERATQFKAQWEYLHGAFPDKPGTKAHEMANDAMMWEKEHPGQGMNRYRDNVNIDTWEPLLTPENLAALQKAYPQDKDIPKPERLAVWLQHPEMRRQAILKLGAMINGMSQQQQTAGGGGEWSAAGITPRQENTGPPPLTAPFRTTAMPGLGG